MIENIAAPLPPTPQPRSRDAQSTRAAILRAGRKLFAEKGYSTTGVREVAAEAGVNSSLVRRYFGSKEGLFREAIEVELIVAPFLEGPRASFGKRAVRILLTGDAGPSAMAMMLLASADPSARLLCRDLLQTHIFEPMARWLGGARAEEQAACLNILWVGFMTTRQILMMDALRDEKLPPLLNWLERSTQAIVDAP